LKDDSKLAISRIQVEVLPNFAMTDFASQGKTHPYNPVDLTKLTILLCQEVLQLLVL